MMKESPSGHDVGHTPLGDAVSSFSLDDILRMRSEVLRIRNQILMLKGSIATLQTEISRIRNGLKILEDDLEKVSERAIRSTYLMAAVLVGGVGVPKWVICLGMLLSLMMTLVLICKIPIFNC